MCERCIKNNILSSFIFTERLPRLPGNQPKFANLHESVQFAVGCDIEMKIYIYLCPKNIFSNVHVRFSDIRHRGGDIMTLRLCQQRNGTCHEHLDLSNKNVYLNHRRLVDWNILLRYSHKRVIMQTTTKPYKQTLRNLL